jgi:hypothetical protein
MFTDINSSYKYTINTGFVLVPFILLAAGFTFLKQNILTEIFISLYQLHYWNKIFIWNFNFTLPVTPLKQNILVEMFTSPVYLFTCLFIHQLHSWNKIFLLKHSFYSLSYTPVQLLEIGLYVCLMDFQIDKSCWQKADLAKMVLKTALRIPVTCSELCFTF